MLSLVPPAGTPTSFFDIFSTLSARLSFNDQSRELYELVGAFSGAKYIHCTNSGRTALSVILKSFAAQASSDKNEVVIPAYTCFTVAAAVARCNLKIKLVDINPATLDYNYDKLREIDSEKVLAVIGCNLFGIPSNWKELTAFAKARNIKLIDDAAQALGSVSNSKPLGSNGDAGFYSLGRGKNLSTYSGGIIITSDEELNRKIFKQLELIKEPGIFSEANNFAKIILYSVFLNPHLYRLAASIPFLGIGKTEFNLDLGPAKLSKLQVCLAHQMLPKLDEFNSARTNNAMLLINALAKLNNLTVIGLSSEYKTNYLRLPVLCIDGVSRDEAIKQLRKAGISASAMYPSSIRNILNIEPYLADQSDCFEGAEQVVERLLALPTHPNLKPRDIQIIISCLGRL